MSKSPEIPNASPAVQEASAIYCALMEEIKIRLTAIQYFVDRMKAKPTETLGFIQAESAILQLRNVCELMALAALAAHHPFGLLDDTLLESWNARLAFRDVAKLSSRSFPQPIRSIIQKPDGTKFIDDNPKGLPTLRGLMRCYSRCGSLLHRGVVKHAFEKKQKLYDVDWIEEWGVRIGELLVSHTMVIPEHSFALIVDFYGGAAAEVSVKVAFASGPGRFAAPAKAGMTRHPAGK